MFLKKIFFILMFCLTVVFTVAYIYINRNEEDFLHCYKSLMTLYYPKELPVIKSLNRSRAGNLLIKISSSSQANKWEISVDNGKQMENFGKDPEFKLIEGLHSYRLKSDAFPDVLMKINYVPSRVYKKAGNSNSDVIDIVNSSAPLGEFERHPVDFFVFDPKCYSANEIDQARQIIKEETDIKAGDPTDEKIIKLGSFLIRKTSDKGGIPSRKARDMTPLEQYLAALKGEVKLWCHNYAEIYVFFANAAGIPTRKVSIGGEFDGFSLSGHAFAESYIKEQGRWAYVDITSLELLIKNSHGLYMSALDLFYINFVKAFSDKFTVICIRKGKLCERPLIGGAAHSEKYYFRRDAFFSYPIPVKNSFFKKEFRYIFNPSFAYSLRPSNAKRNLVLFFVYGEVLLILFWILSIIIYAKPLTSKALLFLRKRQNNNSI